MMTTGTSGSVTDIPPPPPQDVDAQAFCKVPNVDAGSLPFVVDTAFVPSGWMGDAPAYAAVPAYPATGSPAYPATTARMTLFADRLLAHRRRVHAGRRWSLEPDGERSLLEGHLRSLPQDHSARWRTGGNEDRRRPRLRVGGRVLAISTQ